MGICCMGICGCMGICCMGICCIGGIIACPPKGGMTLIVAQNGQLACTIWFMAGIAKAEPQVWQDHVTSCC